MSYSSVNVYERGQVWMVSEPKEVTDAKINSGDRTICYTRPCVILTPSNEMDGPLITVVPITSKIGTVTDTDIIFRNHDLEQNKIMIKQLTTKDSSMFIRYMFSLPEDIMKDIDRKVSEYLGIQNDIDLERVSALERELEKAKECIKILGKQLDEAQGIKSVSEIGVRKTEETSVIHKTYKKWSLDTAKQFLEDRRLLTMGEVQEKYGLNTNASVYSLTYSLKKKFNLA